MPDAHSPVRAGDSAPEFVLPAADRDGNVALRDYLGRSAVFLGLFRGLYCAFCRRAVADLGRLSTNLAQLDIQTLGVVATPTPHARLYFKYRQVPIALGADPAMATHAAYGLPKVLKGELGFVDTHQSDWRVERAAVDLGGEQGARAARSIQADPNRP